MAEDAQSVVGKIKSANWWQGALASGHCVPGLMDAEPPHWWIVTSQTCNIYNPCLEKVPVVEFVAATQIEACEPNQVKGDNPRTIHVKAQSSEGDISLAIDIQRRFWLCRKKLAKLPPPKYFIKDAPDGKPQDQWLDIFTGWLARSYTRVTLPDAFNIALDKSKIKEVFIKKLARQKDSLHGIYFSISPDSDEQWSGALGLMPAPYLLEIKLVTYQHVDPENIKVQLVEQLFEEKVENPDNKSEKLSRAELARKYGIRVLRDGITAEAETEISLFTLKSLIRYSMVDHLSDSTMAYPDP